MAKTVAMAATAITVNTVHMAATTATLIVAMATRMTPQ